MVAGSVGEVIMSKDGSFFRTNQAGIVAGSVGNLSKVQVTQNSASQDHVDLERLARELDELLSEARRRAASPEAQVESSIVMLARDAAVEGDRSRLAVALSKLGQWTLSLAAELGKAAVTAAVKGALGGM